MAYLSLSYGYCRRLNGIIDLFRSDILLTLLVFISLAIQKRKHTGLTTLNSIQTKQMHCHKQQLARSHSFCILFLCQIICCGLYYFGVRMSIKASGIKPKYFLEKISLLISNN